jgi:thioredoxin-dependent peroxiredoxin
MGITIGAPAPAFTLRDQNGDEWSLEGHRGQPVVLYFYPRDDTPGCTNQACDIRDNWAEFTEAGAVVAGISPDDVDSHERFAAKHDLPHTLLADPDKEVIEAYGAWGERKMYGKSYQGVIRSSVVIAADGTVAAVFDKIRPKDQAKKSLAAIRDLTG